MVVSLNSRRESNKEEKKHLGYALGVRLGFGVQGLGYNGEGFRESRRCSRDT